MNAQPITTNPANTTPGRRTPVFTGLKPTGQLQLGNYLGAIRPLLGLATDPDNQVTASIADLHALTVDHNPVSLRQRTLQIAATLIACGLPDDTRLFVQSSVPGYTELHYLLESTATYGEMHRMVQFKEKSDGQESHRLSLLSYPVLMAADILGSRAEVVPVGEDQKQHLELTRAIAKRFNRKYGNTFRVPKGVTPPEEARLKDLHDPAAKMGKSGAETHGVIFLLDTPDMVATKVRRATTDTDPVLTYDPATRPGVANLAVILGALTGTSPATALVGLHGGAALKTAVTDALINTLTPIQENYTTVMANQDHLLARLRDNAATVSQTVSATVATTREAIGLISL